MNIIIPKLFMAQPACANKYQKGFSLLMLFLALLVVAVAVIGFLFMSGVQSGKSSSTLEKSAKGIANACIEVALSSIKYNNAFTGTVNLTFGSDTCSATVTNTGGATRLVSGQANIGAIVRKVTISISSLNPIVISSWQETP